jgi:PilZ domain
MEEEAMQDRRESVRDRVLLGGVAEINRSGSTMDCVVRNISERGACIEFDQAAKVPEEMNLTISRKGRSFLARLIWRQANKVGLAFRIMTSDRPVDDLDERLRRSEIKKRQLQRRINELLGEG